MKTYCTSFICPSIDGHLGCFRIFTIMNSTTRNILLLLLWPMPFLHSPCPSRTLIRYRLALLSLWYHLFPLWVLFWSDLYFGQFIHITTDFPVHEFSIQLCLICFTEPLDWNFHFKAYISFQEVTPHQSAQSFCS